MPKSIHAETSLRDVYRIFFRHRNKAVAFFVTAMTCFVLYAFLAPEVYRSEAKLFLRLGRENVRLDPTATLGQSSVVAIPTNREEEINSVAEFLRSRKLIEKAVDAVGPAAILGQKEKVEVLPRVIPLTEKKSESPEKQEVWDASDRESTSLSDRDRAVIKLGDKLNVYPIKKTNVLAVSYESRDPQLSQRVVARLIEFFLEEHVHLNRTQGAKDFLVDQTNRVKEKLTDAETRLRDKKNAAGIVSSDEQRKIFESRIGVLQGELLTTESSLAASIAEALLLEDSLFGLSKMPVTGRITGLATTQPADTVRQHLYSLQLRKQQLLSRYTENHVEVAQIRDEITSAKEAMMRHTQKSEGNPSEILNSKDHSALIAREPALASLAAKAKILRKQLATMKQDLQTFNRDSLEIAQLERESSLLDTSYRRYSENLEQARIDQSLEDQQISNITVAQPATFNRKAASPKKLIILIVGFCVALFGSAGLALVSEYLDHSIKTPEEVEHQLEIPTLVAIPYLDRSTLAWSGRN